MNEEEKKIIEAINDYIKKKEELGDLGDDFTINFRDTKPLKILLNLIEKQQEEIKELNERIKEALEEIDTGEYTAYTLYGDILFEDNDLVKILKGE